MYVEKNIINPTLLHQHEHVDAQELGSFFIHKRDAYDKLSHDQVISFLNESLKQAIKDVLTGKEDSIEQAVELLIGKLVTRRSYSDWINEHYPNKYFIPKLVQAKNELGEAQTIILKSERDYAAAQKVLSAANWNYIDKSFVNSLLSKKAAIGTNLTQTNQAQSSMGSGIIDWVRNNKTMAIGLSAVTVIGFLYMRNQEQN